MSDEWRGSFRAVQIINIAHLISYVSYFGCITTLVCVLIIYTNISKTWLANIRIAHKKSRI